MAFPTRLTKVGYSSEHFNERTGMCYHQTPPWERVVAYVGDARQAKPHLEHSPLSLLGVRHAIPMRKLNDPDCAYILLHMAPPGLSPGAQSIGDKQRALQQGLANKEKRHVLQQLSQIGGVHPTFKGLR